jgi:hypothetical protein
MGASAGLRTRLRDEACALVRREGLVDAAYSYDIAPVAASNAGRLRAGGECLDGPRLIPQSGALTHIACAACTLGPRLEQRVSELFAERRPSLALALDEIGNELLSALCRMLQDRMLADASRRGLSMAGELRAGDPGLGLDAQAAVLRLAHAESIGVGLTSGRLMRPVKSLSMVLGVGIDLPPAEWSRCDDCPSRAKCRVARSAEAAVA